MSSISKIKIALIAFMLLLSACEKVNCTLQAVAGGSNSCMEVINE